jgi:hypothetical protein
MIQLCHQVALKIDLAKGKNSDARRFIVIISFTAMIQLCHQVALKVNLAKGKHSDARRFIVIISFTV